MKLHIINLEERVDRNYEMKQQCKKYGYQYKMIRAIRGEGSYGPGMSHCNCINYAIENNLDMILVCEDDVLLKEDTISRLKEILKCLPYDWDLFLGGASGLDNCVKINDLIFKVGDFSGLHFVVYRERSYTKVLEWLNSKKVRGFRRFGRYQHIDRFLGNMSKKGKLNVYAPFNFLADTFDSYSDVRKIQTSDASLFEKAKNYLNTII